MLASIRWSLLRPALLCLPAMLAAGACRPAADPTGAPAPATAPAIAWPLRTYEHVDLWLHGFALLTQDTARVPIFERGYRQRIQTLRQERAVATALDANRTQLSARFTANPDLGNGQFAAFYFPSWTDLTRAVEAFVRAGGDLRGAGDQTMQFYFRVLAASFRTAPDREWLRLFTQSLADEHARFYRDYWAAQQRERAAARMAVDSLWRTVYLPRFRGFLNNTQQATGEFILSLPLGAEGRTISEGRRANAIATAHPATAATAVEAVYVFAHEAMIGVANTTVADHTTPAEQRAGVTAGLAGTAAVRGAAMLLQRVAPELATGYMRYYLTAAGATAPTGDPTAAFAAAFPLPELIRDALARQLDLVLGGI